MVFLIDHLLHFEMIGCDLEADLNIVIDWLTFSDTKSNPGPDESLILSVLINIGFLISYFCQVIKLQCHDS